MQSMTSVEEQSRFGELIDRAQREPIALTRHGRVVAYVVSEHDMRLDAQVAQRRAEAVRWYSDYRTRLEASVDASVAMLNDADIYRMVHESR